MKGQSIPITVWLPLLAALFVATIGGGLGVIFMILHDTWGEDLAHKWGNEEWVEFPVIILGLAIVVLVPLICAVIHARGGSQHR